MSTQGTFEEFFAAMAGRPPSARANHVARVRDEAMAIEKISALHDVAERNCAMAQRGGIPTFNIGGHWGIQSADFDKWVDAQRRSGDGGLRGD